MHRLLIVAIEISSVSLSGTKHILWLSQFLSLLWLKSVISASLTVLASVMAYSMQRDFVGHFPVVYFTLRGTSWNGGSLGDILRISVYNVDRMVRKGWERNNQPIMKFHPVSNVEGLRKT